MARNQEPISVLFVEDDPDAQELVCAGLMEMGIHVDTADSAERALDLLRSSRFDVVVTDVGLGRMEGIGLCESIFEIDSTLPVIIATARRETETAIAAIRAHVHDYLTKPLDLEHLVSAINRVVRERRVVDEIARLTDNAVVDNEASCLRGHDPKMREILDVVERVAHMSSTVLISGESGTGKELVARAIHDRGSRTGSFVAVNCAAIPKDLFESELFGHVRGAFTNALSGRDGLFVQADGGTLLLDEIGEMPCDIQVKLLRALQERRVRPVGGDQTVEFDARIIAATNRDLERAVESNRFRADLYYRLNIISIAVPPLRERQGDILPLAQYFVARSAERFGKRVTRLSQPAASMLLGYQWPGNVRELENAIEYAVAMTQFNAVLPEDLPPRLREEGLSKVDSSSAVDEGPLPTLEEIEREHVVRVLRCLEGNRTQAAKVLGVTRRSLYRRMHRLHIETSA